MARQARDPFFTFTMGDKENPRQKLSVWNYGETVSQSWSFNINMCHQVSGYLPQFQTPGQRSKL